MGDVFQILDDSPLAKRHFRVSRLHKDGTDAEQGVIPNYYKAQQYVEEQGEGNYICHIMWGYIHNPVTLVTVKLL